MSEAKLICTTNVASFGRWGGARPENSEGGRFGAQGPGLAGKGLQMIQISLVMEEEKL
jgi:hypothetical protein